MTDRKTSKGGWHDEYSNKKGRYACRSENDFRKQPRVMHIYHINEYWLNGMMEWSFDP